MGKNRPKFGQGIHALLSNIEVEQEENKEKVVAELANAVAPIPMAYIASNPDQPRKDFDEVTLRELADSIRVHGVIQPITVRRLAEKQYQIISGERRYQAAKMAGLEEMPAFIRIVNDQELLEMALVENIQRQDLNAVEIATTYARLLDECQLTHEQLAERVGKNRSTITNYLRLLKLPPTIQEGLRDGDITIGQVRPLAALEDEALQLTLYKEIREKGLNARQIEDLVKQYTDRHATATAAKKTPPALPAEYRRIQDTLTSRLESKVLLKRATNGKGQIVINFSSDDDLSRLLDLLEK